jgi:cell division protein FtsZ
MEFELPKSESTSIIKVIGVGGGGSNAVNHMYNQGIKGVDFIICNTDQQALDASPVPTKIQLGLSLTEGRGAGSIPEIGKNAAIENIEELRALLETDTKMVFVTAGMGGGTGTGAAPVIAQIAKDLGILTVGIITVPFSFEGRKRKQQAELGLEELRNSVDTLLIINNDRLRDMFGNLSLGNAFSQADDILTTAAKGIAEVISVTGAINVDFNDVNTVMKDSGVAIMGSAVAEGEERAIKAVEKAMASPLLNDNDIAGAKYVLLNITYGTQEVLMDEIAEITDFIQDEAGSTADVIWGHGHDETLGEGICVTLIATGFKTSPITGFEKAPEKKVTVLEEKRQEIAAPITSPTSSTWNDEKKEEVEDAPFLVKKEVTEVADTWAKKEEVIAEAPVEIQNEIIAETEEAPVMFNLEDEVTNEVVAEAKEEEVVEETIVAEEAPEKEVKKFFLEDDIEEKTTLESEEVVDQGLTAEEQQRKAQERLNRLKDYTSKIKSPDGLADLEKEPAFKRRNVSLEDSEHSSEFKQSRFNLNFEDNETRLKDNNSFLHDNVD